MASTPCRMLPQNTPRGPRPSGTGSRCRRSRPARGRWFDDRRCRARHRLSASSRRVSAARHGPAARRATAAAGSCDALRAATQLTRVSNCRAVQQVEGDRDDAAVLPVLQERALRPLVERAHRRAAPDLVVELARSARPRSPSATTGPGTSGTPAPSCASGPSLARSTWRGSRCRKNARVCRPDLVERRRGRWFFSSWPRSARRDRFQAGVSCGTARRASRPAWRTSCRA